MHDNVSVPCFFLPKSKKKIQKNIIIKILALELVAILFWKLQIIVKGLFIKDVINQGGKGVCQNIILFDKII